MPVVEEFQSRLIGNCPLSVQAGMATAFQNMGYEKKSVISDYYKQNADFMLKEIGHLLVGGAPEGGFYFVADFSFMLGKPMPESAKSAYTTRKNIIEDDIDICMALMFGFGLDEKEGLGTVPASCFGIDKKRGFERISFSSGMDNLAQVASRMNKIKAFCA